jgi:hypothetical protein
MIEGSFVAAALRSSGLTTQSRDDAAAPCGAVHLAQELSMSPLRRRMIEDMQKFDANILQTV